MLMVSLNYFFVRTVHLFCKNDWVPLENVQLILKFEEMALSEKVFKGSHSLLCLLSIMLFCETEELNQVWVRCQRVSLDEHSKGRYFICGSTLGQHCEVPTPVLRLCQLLCKCFMFPIDNLLCFFIELLS